MKLLRLISVALGGTAAAMVSPSVPVRDRKDMETTEARDVAVADVLPESGGPDPHLSAASLLLAAGVVIYALARRWGRN